jgi:hypothetical protein
MLVDFLIVVLDACHNVGLEVIATMFDMGDKCQGIVSECITWFNRVGIVVA